MDHAEHGEALQRFADWSPTQFDARGLGAEGQEDWRVLPCMRTRDSGALNESNFAVASRMIESAGVDHEVHRFGHWGPGWIEILVVAPTPEGLRLAGEIACALASYPILDEADLGEREAEAALATWRIIGYDGFVRAAVDCYELAESTADWLCDATDREKDHALSWRDERSSSVYSAEDDGTRPEPDQWAEREAFAAFLRAMRAIRRADASE